MKRIRLLPVCTAVLAFAAMTLTGCASTAKRGCASCPSNKDGICEATGKPCSSCCASGECTPKRS